MINNDVYQHYKPAIDRCLTCAVELGGDRLSMAAGQDQSNIATINLIKLLANGTDWDVLAKRLLCVPCVPIHDEQISVIFCVASHYGAALSINNGGKSEPCQLRP